MEKLVRHCQADSAYLDEGARLVDGASRAFDLYRRHGLVELRGFLATILENVQVKDGRVTAQYRQAFKILSQMAAETVPPPSASGRGGGVKSNGMGWLAGLEPATPRSTIWCSAY